MLEALLTAAFDATPEKLEAARAPLAASLRATSLQAARCVPLMAHSMMLLARPWHGQAVLALGRQLQCWGAGEWCEQGEYANSAPSSQRTGRDQGG